MKTKKELKAEYDKEYRKRKGEELKLKKKLYAQSENGRAMQKRQREKRKEYHNAYCRLPEQRKKEKINRHKRNGVFNVLKTCLRCEIEKPILSFESMLVFPDKRNYLCRCCEKETIENIGVSTKQSIQAIVTLSDYKLTRYDVAKHPYLIECKKYLITLQKLTK